MTTTETVAEVPQRLWTPQGWERPGPYSARTLRPATANDPRWAKLREPFPARQIGKLPRVWCRACSDRPKGQTCENHKMDTCRVCRNRITTGHLHLDYVGHAAVTSRLLEVDPFWNWRGATKAELEDLPKHNPERELWIVLTVLGVDRYGIGDDTGRGGTDGKKIMIGDAIRNAAMRFGVALDLWSKEDLAASAEAEAEQADEVKRGLAGDPDAPPAEDWVGLAKNCTTLDELTALAARCNDKSEFKGAAKAAMAGKRRQLEQAAKKAAAESGPPAEPKPAAE